MSEGMSYPAIYSDRYGEEKTIIQNDGKSLRMSLRGVIFSGSMFDDFEPSNIEEAKLTLFPMHAGALCSYKLDCQIPISIVMFDKEIEGILKHILSLVTLLQMVA